MSLRYTMHGTNMRHSEVQGDGQTGHNFLFVDNC